MKLVLFWLLAVTGLFAQVKQKSLFWEVYAYPQDSTYKLYIPYKISLDKLVFVKENSHFTAGLDFYLEVETNGEIYTRANDSRSISVNSYEETNSSQKFLEGLIELELKPGEYKFSTEIDLHNTNNVYRVAAKDYILHKLSEKVILNPLCIKGMLDPSSQKFELLNFDGSVPMERYDYTLIVPVLNYKKATIDFVFKQEEDFSLETKGKRLEWNSVSFGNLDANIVINPELNKTSEISFYNLGNITKKLTDGTYEISLKDSGEYKRVSFDVLWMKRPKSLDDAEKAVKYLENIADQKDYKQLIDKDDEEYYSELKKYWARFDPDTSTAFNEVMYEFYSRVDTANTEYKALGSTEGVKTDRGQVYIKFGRPEKVERNYAENNKVIEIWYYTKFNKKFIFEDITGTGNFSLLK